MVNSLAKVSYGYTDKGNRYEKSSNGKKIGTIAGTTYLACRFVAANNRSKRDKMLDISKEMKEAYSAKKLGVVGNKILKLFIETDDFLSKTKDIPVTEMSNKMLLKRCTLPVFALAVGVGWILLNTVVAGKLLGRGYDKIVDHFSMKKADKAVESQQK